MFEPLTEAVEISIRISRKFGCGRLTRVRDIEITNVTTTGAVKTADGARARNYKRVRCF